MLAAFKQFMPQKLSIIIPVFNEEATISQLIDKVIGTDLDVEKEVIVVDDGSRDGTSDILALYKKTSGIRVITLDRNTGKAGAVKKGIENSCGTILLVQDADLEYDPSHYPSLIEPIIKGDCLVVYGSRFKGSVKGMPIINRVANWITNATANLLFGSSLSDVNTGFKVFSRSAMDSIALIGRNFVFDTEITAKFLKKGIFIKEVPVEYKSRKAKEGRKMTWLTAVEMFFGLLRYRFTDL